MPGVRLLLNEDEGKIMKRFTPRFLIALTTFFAGVIATLWLINRQPVVQLPQAEESVLVVNVKKRELSPDYRWMPGHFTSIKERLRVSGLPDLESYTLPEGDLEVRVWGGFGLTGLEGFILKRATGHWSATHLYPIPSQIPNSKYPRRLRDPKSGWEACWKRLVDAGLLTLPDESVLEGKKPVTDGFSYVVEVKEGGSYRTYHYGNPAHQDWDEAKKMLGLGEIISDEFGLSGLAG
jgi:hypothetical protein